MGYNTHPGLIRDNLAILDAIFKSVTSGADLRIESDSPSLLQYQLRRLLAACDRHPKEAGPFAGLGAKVRISVKPPSTVVISPKTIRGISLAGTSRMRYDPSSGMTEDEFVEMLEELGWKVHRSSRIQNADSSVEFAVERTGGNGPASSSPSK